MNEEIAFPFPAGVNEVVIDNPGADWIMLDAVTLPGVGPGVSAVSLRTERYGLARLQWQKEFGPQPKSLSLPGLQNGAYEMRQFDLEAGTEKVSRVKIEQGRLVGYVPFALDEGLAFFKR